MSKQVMAPRAKSGEPKTVAEEIKGEPMVASGIGSDNRVVFDAASTHCSRVLSQAVFNDTTTLDPLDIGNAATSNVTRSKTSRMPCQAIIGIRLVGRTCSGRRSFTSSQDRFCNGKFVYQQGQRCSTDAASNDSLHSGELVATCNARDPATSIARRNCVRFRCIFVERH